jgi:hypothetical protein
VDLSAALLGRLQDLTVSIGQDDQDIDDTLAALTTALRSTAASYCGFQLTIVENQWPITLTAFSDGHDVPVGTSLRLPLALVSQAVDLESRIVFFAFTPGAFTDLAADLSYALGDIPVEQQSPASYNADGGRTFVDGQRNAIELDSDLPLVSLVSGLTGLAELRVLNRAIGMFVDQGNDIEQAHQVLRRDAAAARVEPHVYATRILRRRMRPSDQRTPFVRHAGWLCIAAGALFLIAQIVMLTFDQSQNLETSQHPVFIAAKIIYLGGFIVLMFALIAVYGLQASRAGRLGIAGFGLAIAGTMMLAGDLWFESLAVPSLAAGPGSQGLTSAPSVIMGLGAISSYILFAAGWALFGIASVRARVLPLPVSLAIILGGIAGYWALLAPGGIPLGVALTMLGIWIVIVRRSTRMSAQ